MSRKRTIVGGVETLSEEQTIVASFHDFANLPHEQNFSTRSPRIQCHGHSWVIRVYPGHHKRQSGDTTFVSIYLYLEDDPPFDVPAKVTLRACATMRWTNKHTFKRGEVGLN
jgi:hypothetical protein